MTENKRFTIFGEWHKDCVIDEIRDNTGEYVTIGRVVDLLNENEQLKRLMRKSVVERLLDGFEKSYKDLEEENKQLKIELNKQNDFKDKVFHLINTKLKEADKGFKMTYDSWYQGKVDSLKELKKELITGESK